MKKLMLIAIIGIGLVISINTLYGASDKTEIYRIHIESLLISIGIIHRFMLLGRESLLRLEYLIHGQEKVLNE